MPETLNEVSFKSLGLPRNLLDLLDRLGFVTPTPIQNLSIPIASKGTDMIGIAQTGTGKTLAFALPIAARLQQDRMALVLAPTRELAEQIAVVFQKLGLNTALLIGGEGMQKQKNQLRSRVQVIVATPGRLEDHIRQGYRALKHAEIVVLDEADRMLDMGFAPAIHRILGHVPTDRQTMLFSATMPKEISDLASAYLRNPARVDVKPSGTTAEGIDQELVIVNKDDKPGVLGDLLAAHNGSILVFARTRHGARKIAHSIRVLGHSAAEIHADRSLPQRRAALEGFKTGEHRVLVATDIAARGIDVKDISLVINYDVPEKPEDYIHRIGRTGRAGARGLAIMIATPDQQRDVLDIERLMRITIPVSPRSRVRMAATNAGHERSAQRRQPQGRPSSPGRPPRAEGNAPKAPDTRSHGAPRHEAKPHDHRPARPSNPMPNAKVDQPIKPKRTDHSDRPKGGQSETPAAKSTGFHRGPASNPKPRRLNWSGGRPTSKKRR